MFSVDAWFAIAFSEINGQPRSEFPRSLYPLPRSLRTNAHDSLKNLSSPTGVSPVCAKPFPVNRPSFQTDLYKSCLSPPKLCPKPPDIPQTGTSLRPFPVHESLRVHRGTWESALSSFVSTVLAFRQLGTASEGRKSDQ